MVVGDRDEAVAVADEYAPEHLEVQTADPEWFVERLRNYGTLCVGEEATIAFSDKAIGTNHTLPTGGPPATRAASGWASSSRRSPTSAARAKGALDIAPHAGRLSDAEQMFGHGITAYRRRDKYAARRTT